MKEKEEAETTTEPMAKRVGEHPFLGGLTREQLTLLTDCALPAHFKFGEVIFETIGAGDVLGWSWMMSPYQWHFTARAVEPTDAIFFASPILRQYCERDHSLGFEPHKRVSTIMMKRLQAARKKMLVMHVHGEKLEPVVLESPFLDQELDIPEV
jgi:hypothetical protein